MAPQYAKDQPAGFKNRIEKVAIVGATGQIGGYIARALVKTGQHKVTALTRAGATSTVPSGVTAQKVDYDDHAALVSALRGQEVLIITLAVTVPADLEGRIVRAAGEAEVAWIFPNEWGTDTANEGLLRDMAYGQSKAQTRREIEAHAHSAWIAFVTSFWYEYSLAAHANAYGFDFATKTLTLYDEGTTRINTSTWDQCGRGVAALLSLKVLPENEADDAPTLSRFRNEFVYVSSFLISQRDMFNSVLRVTGDSEADWTVRHEDVRERFTAGIEAMKAGDRLGFIKALYARIFFPDGTGNFQDQPDKGLCNDLLGLPEEDLDQATKFGVEMSADGGPWLRRNK